ncbi:S1 RNA-binding domain-containing protein 1 isoform X2 [Linepithema humile]
MKRSLRSKCNQPIIEISDSDDEEHKIFSKGLKDESYVPEESKRKIEVIADNKKPKRRIKKAAQTKDAESTKRKAAEENLESKFNNKKQKQEEPSLTDYSEVSQQNQKNQTNIEIKHDEKIENKLKFSSCAEWTDVEYISEINNVDIQIAKNVVKLFSSDNTIPFIARYRKNVTGSMEPDQLRALKDSFEQAKVIKHRAATIIKTIDKLGKWSPEIHSAITSAKSLTDLEELYSFYKPTTKRLLAERARALGLERISNAILQGQQIPSLMSLVDKQKEGLRSEEDVRQGIVHILADVISKDKEVFDKVTSCRKMFTIEIQTTQCKATKEDPKKSPKSNEHKYEGYFNFKASEKNIRPHQVLAINRAESQKYINVKVVVPDAFEQSFKRCCVWQYIHRQSLTGNMTTLHRDLLNSSIDHTYKKLIKPLVMRRVRSEVKERAETASIKVFVTNVKQLLLIPPVRGKVVLGIDPGFYHGCKLAVVSEHGNILDTAVIHPHMKNHEKAFQQSAKTLAELVNKHKCTILALGNGTACRETEMFLTKMIESKMFGSLNVRYSIIDECGASIYSCSAEAKSEFPNLDPNLVSAISIARRLQDPMAELVKIEPKHLGVGQYQHDLPEKQLLNALDEVISEAVSYVGVDINTASQCLLRRVAGLTNSRAASIIEWRIKHGPFKNREQLLNVKGIGSKTFEQCAGFIRILPETAVISGTPAERGAESKKSKKSNSDLNLLDQTWIHPESYAIANKFIEHCECKLDDLGTPAFIDRINSHVKVGCVKLAAQFDTNEATMEIIVKALTMKKDEDIRLKSDRPLFRTGARSIKDLSVDTVLSGVVRNVTHFGAFIDVGIDTHGLIHFSRMKKETLHVGQRVEVKIIKIELARNRVSLELIKSLDN